MLYLFTFRNHCWIFWNFVKVCILQIKKSFVVWEERIKRELSFDGFQMQKWMLKTNWAWIVDKKMGWFAYLPTFFLSVYLGVLEKSCCIFEKHGAMYLLFLFRSWVNAIRTSIKYEEKCWRSKDFTKLLQF